MLTLNLTEEEVEILHRAIDVAFSEGMLPGWLSEKNMLLLGFGDKKWIMERVRKDVLTWTMPSDDQGASSAKHTN